MKLALRNPDYFKCILAVTFTNKATEEMKSRIVEVLTSLSTGASGLSHELKASLGFDDDELSKRANLVLKNILHNYSSFGVMTIDAFFQKVVRSFAREVGIQGGFQVELDQKKVLAEVVDKVFMNLGENPSLTKWMVDFAIYRINNGKNWESKRDINSLSEELFKEVVIQERDRLFSVLEDEKFMPDFISSLHEVVRNFQNDLTTLAKNCINRMEAHGISALDFSYGMSGVGGYLLKLSQGKLIEPTSRALSAVNKDQWTTMSSTKRDEILLAVDDGIRENLQAIIRLWEEKGPEFATVDQVIKNIYTFGLLSEVGIQLRAYREQNDLLLISDFPIFLNEIIEDSDTPYIYEKIGNRYRHYLIDEFQDTSGIQWLNFKPLVKDTIDAGRFSMVVGDIKQSIYRWRGGNWKLLLEKIKEDVGDSYAKELPLKSNWRSRYQIIDFNNRFFSQAAEILFEHFKKEAAIDIEEVSNIRNAYEDVIQNHVDGEHSDEGLIDIRFFDKQEVDSTKEESLRQLTLHIEQLQHSNYQLRDIAILVRNKKEGDLITQYLMDCANSNENSAFKYDIISNESLFLKNSAVVNFLMSALKFLLNPGETIYRVELAFAWHVHLEERQSSVAIESIISNNNPVKILESNYDRIISLPLPDQVDSIINLFELNDYHNQYAYLIAFKDVLLDYQSNDGTGILNFLDWWEENIERSIQVSDELDAIRLMTIHKSKGLQFKVVLIPFANWRLDHNALHDNIVWSSTAGHSPFDQLPLIPVKYKKDMGKTFFAKDYSDEKVKIHVDHLNLLYVAMTRAEEALFVMAECDSKKNVLAGVNDLLLEYVNRNDQLIEYEVEKNHYRIGSLSTYSVYEKDVEFEEFRLDKLTSNPWIENDALRIRTGISQKGALEKINYGVVIHFILSKVKLTEDFSSAIRVAAEEYGLDQKEIGGIKKKLRRILDLEQLSDWFSGSWEVKNEIDIIMPNGQSKRPDRVMIKNDLAVILDYKTGEQNNSHSKQVNEYKSLMKSMGYNVQGYLLYINEPILVKVT